MIRPCQVRKKASREQRRGTPVPLSRI